MGASLDREKTQGQRPGAHLHTVYRSTKEGTSKGAREEGARQVGGKGEQGDWSDSCPFWTDAPFSLPASSTSITHQALVGTTPRPEMLRGRDWVCLVHNCGS